jgi:uncharacterized protein YggT (Ycf19 family)
MSSLAQHSPPRARPAEEAASAAVLSLWVARALVWLVYAFASVACILLLIAFFLQLTGANPAAPFAAWVYRSSDDLLQPFRSLYPTERFHNSQSELNLSVVFAIFMYGLFAVLLACALGWLDRWIRGLGRVPPPGTLEPWPAAPERGRAEGIG